MAEVTVELHAGPTAIASGTKERVGRRVSLRLVMVGS
jgi:hypothetical protein